MEYQSLCNAGNLYPRARLDKIVTQEVLNELLVYDLDQDKAHHLNEPVAYVWQMCDGKTSVEDLRNRLSEKLGAEVEEDFVVLAISELERSKLMADAKTTNSVSRRDIIVKYAGTAAAIPVVLSLVAPNPALAQSCVPLGGPCGLSGDCCPPATDCTGICIIES